MTDWLSRNEPRARQLLALLAGLLLALAFPRVSAAGFAWFAPGLLLLTALGADGRTRFQSGWIGGLAFSLVTLHWLNYMPVTGLPVLAWLCLSAYLACYYGVWTWGCGALLPDENPGEARPSLTRVADRLDALGQGGRIRWALSAAALWTALEFAQGRLLTGFPWLHLGVTQQALPPLRQFASVAGVEGISFLVVWFALSLLLALLALVRSPRDRLAAWRQLGPALLAVTVVFTWGTFRLRELHAQPVREVRLALVQPGIPQTLLWDQASAGRRFQKLLELTRAALATKPDLLIWPEAAVPGLLRYDEQVGRPIAALAREHGVWIICGADDARFPPGAEEGSRPDYFNSAFLLNPRGELAAQYDKRRLVIFGEYIPLARWLPFLKWFTPIGAGFQAGRGPVTWSLPELNVRTSVLICFEDIFAWVAREAAGPDVDFLVNLTNDGWFAESAAQWQHLANALFRAVETGRPLVRCTNNGITCWIDATGRVHGQPFADGASVYGEGFKLVTLRLPPTPGGAARTFYSRHGDWFAWACVAGVALLAASTWCRRGRGLPVAGGTA